MTTISYEITADEATAVADAVQPFRKQVNDSPALTSLLYDIDLLPEQIRLFANAKRMIAICLMFKVMTDEQIKQLMEGGS